MHFVQVRFPFVVMSDLCLLCFYFSHPVVIMCIFKSSVSLCLLLHFSCSLVYAKFLAYKILFLVYLLFASFRVSLYFIF